MNENRFASRRFALVAASCLIYTLLLVWGYIDAAAYQNLQLWTVGGYIAGNGAQKYTDARYGNAAKPT